MLATLQFLRPPSADVSWMLYAAERLLDGGRLYRDVVEINPPLIIWLSILPAALGRLLAVPGVLIFDLLVVAAGLVSLAMSLALAGRLAIVAAYPHRWAVATLGLFVLLPLAGPDLGQREHLLVILALPYLVLAANRLEGHAVPDRQALAAGVMAGVGIALKPYFLLLPVSVELLLLRSSVRVRSRLEIGGMAALLAAYLLATVLVAGEYWELVRLWGPAYLEFVRQPVLLTALVGDGAAVGLIGLLAFVALRRESGGEPLGRVLFVATAALFASAVLQQKGWRYHFYPSMATALLLLGVLIRSPARPQSPAARVYKAIAWAMLLFLPLSVLAAASARLLNPSDPEHLPDPDLPALAQLIRREAPGGSVMVLSMKISSAFPLVQESGARWSLRFPSLWMLAAAYQDRLELPQAFRYRDLAERHPMERELARAVVDDLALGRPDLVVVLRPGPDRWQWGARRLDYLEYFGADPRFAREFEAYGWLQDVGEYRVYKRMPPGLRRSPPPDVRATGVEPAPSAVRPGLYLAGLGLRRVAQGAGFLGCLLLGCLFERRRSVAATP